MSSERTTPAKDQPRGLQRLMECWFGREAHAVAEAIARDQGAPQDRNNARGGTIMPMRPKHFDLIVAPVDPQKINMADRVTVDKLMMLINTTPERRVLLQLVAETLQMSMDDVHKAIIAVGSEADHDFMLVVIGDPETAQPYVEMAPRPYDLYERILIHERQAIGAKAASSVQDGDVIFIDGGVHLRGLPRDLPSDNAWRAPQD